MKRILTLILLALAGAPLHAQPLPAQPLQAQLLPQAVDLRTVLGFARDASLAVALERSQVDAASAGRLEAAALPNPTLSYNRQRQPGRLTNFDSDRAQDWTIEQPLLLGGQRGARIKAASRAVDAASARVALTRHEVASEAAAAHVALLLAQERLATVRAGLDELARLRQVVDGRRAGGLASEYEAIRVEVEEATWRARVAEAEAALVERQTALAQALGVAGWRPVARGALAPFAPLRGHAAAGRPEVHPEVLLARREQDAAAALVDVARAERMPAVSVNVGRFWTSKPYGGTTGIGVAVELPLFDRRKGGLDKAKAQVGAAALQRELSEARHSAEVDSMARLVAQHGHALDDFRRRAGARTADLKRMAHDSYRLGKTSIAELLDATRGGVELALAEQELVAQLMEAQLRLESATGELLHRIDDGRPPVADAFR